MLAQVKRERPQPPSSHLKVHLLPNFESKARKQRWTLQVVWFSNPLPLLRRNAAPPQTSCADRLAARAQSHRLSQLGATHRTTAIFSLTWSWKFSSAAIISDYVLSTYRKAAICYHQPKLWASGYLCITLRDTGWCTNTRVPQNSSPIYPLVGFSTASPSISPFSPRKRQAGLFTLSISGPNKHNRYTAFDIRSLQRLFVLLGLMPHPPAPHARPRTCWQGHTDPESLPGHGDYGCYQSVSDC